MEQARVDYFEEVVFGRAPVVWCAQKSTNPITS
jgi:hypothetical protein